MKSTYIKELRSRGFTLIPLNGKIPAVKNWQKAGPGDYPDAGSNGGNYGVALKPGDLVIDVDPRAFTPGDKPLARLIEKIGALSTFTVKTGGGGLHIYLSKPADIITAHTLKEYPGLEFKSAGRQVVGPGSIHPDTQKAYTVVSPQGAKIEKAPDALLDILKITAVPYSEISTGDKKNNEYKNDSDTQARFIEYLCKVAPISIEGKQGDATAFKVSCAGRDVGLPPTNTLELLAEYWNPRCLPPWEDAELEAKVIHAYKYAKREIGSSRAENAFTPIIHGGDATDAAGDGGGRSGGEGRSGGRGKSTGEKGSGEEIVWQLTKQGQVTKCFYNLLNYMRLPDGGLNGVFGFNEFTGQIEFRAPAPWHKGVMPKHPTLQDKDLSLLKGYLAVKHGFEQSIGAIVEALTVVAHSPSNKYHPVREYLLGLKWDGVLRIDQWLQTYAGVEDNNYVRAVGRKALCAAVARIMTPGCKFDHVLTLEGPQDAGKSMLCSALAGGSKWGADFPVDPHAPDTVAAMQGKWIVELAELSVLKRTEMSALKAFITRRTDKVRVAYGRLHQEYPRQSIFIGSINPEGDSAYLTDSTGNRRWWPVETHGRIDFAGIKRDRDLLFAEALVKFKVGEELFMETEQLRHDAKVVVATRHADDPWTERINAWLHDTTPGACSGAGREFITARDIFIDAMGGIDKSLGRKDIISIANVMRQLGWESVTKRIGNVVTRGYVKKGPVENELEGLI